MYLHIAWVLNKVLSDRGLERIRLERAQISWVTLAWLEMKKQREGVIF